MVRALAHFFGLNSANGFGYLFWSGIGSDIAEVTLIAAVWHHLNCHEDGCFRLGKHRVDGTPYCGSHHLEARKKTPDERG